MAIGPALQEARLKKQLTASQVAELTRMKVQIVDDLEHDDFHRIAATIYGKGFIKLFAECVDLDPVPLIADYLQTLKGGGDPPPVSLAAVVAAADGGDPPAGGQEVDPPVAAAPDDLFSFASARRKHSESAPRPGVSAPPPAKSRHQYEKAPLAVQAARITAGWRERITLLAESVKARLADFKWNDRTLKRFGISLAAVVVLLLLVSIARYLARHPAERPPQDHELILFTLPPEPYVE